MATIKLREILKEKLIKSLYSQMIAVEKSRQLFTTLAAKWKNNYQRDKPKANIEAEESTAVAQNLLPVRCV